MPYPFWPSEEELARGESAHRHRLRHELAHELLVAFIGGPGGQYLAKPSLYISRDAASPADLSSLDAPGAIVVQPKPTVEDSASALVKFMARLAEAFYP